MFFYTGKCFCLRGGEEQRSLGLSQLVRSSDPDCYTYVEHDSKNHLEGGLVQVRQENKRAPCYAIPGKVPRCLVYLPDLYLNCLPQFTFDKDVHYCKPKRYTSHDETQPWYDCIPVGKNKLSSMIKDMCADSGVDTKTNHSLRATGASAMFRANVPEQIIQSITSH